jgi:RNA polymerase sigma factor (sigma-70 family)
MRVHWTYSGCDRAAQSRTDELWRARQSELEARAVAIGATDKSHLRLFVEYTDSSPLWVVRAALFIGGEAYASEAAHDDLAEALDQTVAILSQRIDERIDEPLEEGNGRGRLERLVPFFESFHSRQRSDAFFSFVLPHFRSLRRYAQREIRTLHMLGELPTERLTVSDVLDEAMLRAWDRFPSRPKDRPFEWWLIQLIDKAIEDGSHSIAAESLESRRPQPTTEPRGSLQDQWVEDPTAPETIEFSRLIPGAPGIEMWDELDVEIKQARLDEIFERLTRPQRQVLMLHAVEGFDTTTIADFQDRPQAEVEQDLVAARSTLERMFREWEWPEIEERLERPSYKRSRWAHRM